jgi:hypothetical protein
MFGRLILFDVGVVDDLSNGNCIENRFNLKFELNYEI